MEQQKAMSGHTSAIASRLGGKPEEIARGLVEFSKSAEALSIDQPKLIHEHPMSWVCVYQGKVSVKADDLPSLMKKLEKQGIPPGVAIIRFIERNQRTLIL